MTYILENRFKFKALYNGKIYDVKSFCEEYVKIYIMGKSKTLVNHVDKIPLKDITKLLQCTGLKDKDGNLAFEGDIVKCKNHIGIIQYSEGFGALIFRKIKTGSFEWDKSVKDVFDTGLGSLMTWSGLMRLNWVDEVGMKVEEDTEEIEIIGNIYYAPELLK